MLKLGSNGIRSLSFHGQILGFVLHYSKSLQTKKEPNSKSLFSVSSYLVESLGFSNEQAISTSAKLFRSWKKVSGLNVATNADYVVKFFEQNGFDQSHIRNAVCCLPRILLARVDKTLKPKFEAFRELGLSESDIAQVVSLNPSILNHSLNSTILPAIRALKEVLPCDDHVFEFIKKSKWITVDNIVKNLVPNVALLQSYGIPIEVIQKRLLQQARCFTLRTESLKDVLIKAEHKWGFCRESKMFIYGVIFLASYDDKSIELKCRVFKNCGWSDSDTLALFRRHPYTLIPTEEKIEKRLNFLMNEVGCVPAYLAANPNLFTYSLEKRLAPRHRVLQLLKEKGLVKEDYSLKHAASLGETKFLERLVRPFKDEVPNLHEIYVKSIGQPALGMEYDACSKR